ncbi:hypothetical protein CYLTODRAFT_489574 [Cylindrobasidium torrendii FP15055 ss-10]|uniref:Uncharacterized protein n=1 Tax=Cylindrobasidium torrendii FP15055 ss-10 TaxID=1314674 RepID=A0A0D7BEP7_9AGAR|nr:hypothetical protein CYLTODRAFT_489574 [Cylindrobasidium torrendii FP15055 ss-10]
MLSALAAAALFGVVAAQDPCASIAGRKWVAPADVRACFTSFAVNETEKTNILDVVNKTLSVFHTSTSYALQLPPPYEDVHEDILADLARISGQEYASDYDLHIDISRSVKRLKDGHCVWANYCYDSAFVNYNPLPLVLVNGETVHIASEAYDVASAEFGDQLSVWEDALSSVQGGLAALSGAEVLAINGADPFEAVNANAEIVGGYQAFATRQNSFFSSYQRASANWSYILGNFAQQSLPLSDSVSLTLRLPEAYDTIEIEVPYYSRIGAISNFTDAASYRAGNCVAVDGTNGVDYYDGSDDSVAPLMKAVQADIPPTRKEYKRMNVILDTTKSVDVTLPPSRQPSDPISGFGVGQFYLLPDNTTGVFAFGSFSAGSFDAGIAGMQAGLQGLKDSGAQKLIVDVTNNGGGYVCFAHALHRLISGPKASTVPNAGLNTTARAHELAQSIVEAIIADPQGVDPDVNLLYNPRQWVDIDDNLPYDADENWLIPPVVKDVNGRREYFSPTLGPDCDESIFSTPPPQEPLFEGADVIIVSNGRCASSCSLFSTTMAKSEGAKTVVVGGKSDQDQKYCGVVGGQSTDFSTMDSELKTTGLKNASLAPPNLLVNGVQGITWRLGYGIDGVDDPTIPEEFLDKPADVNLKLTLELANNPPALWEEVAKLF